MLNCLKSLFYFKKWKLAFGILLPLTKKHSKIEFLLYLTYISWFQFTFYYKSNHTRSKIFKKLNKVAMIWHFRRKCNRTYIDWCEILHPLDGNWGDCKPTYNQSIFNGPRLSPLWPPLNPLGRLEDHPGCKTINEAPLDMLKTSLSSRLQSILMEMGVVIVLSHHYEFNALFLLNH